MRPLVVRGDADDDHRRGLGDKDGREVSRHLRRGSPPQPRHDACRGRPPAEDIDIVLASHLHFDHCGGFTYSAADGAVRPRFPRAQYVVRRGEWEDATHPHERNRASYLPDNFVPLADAGVLQLVDDDQTIMPGVRVKRTGGHTHASSDRLHREGGKTAVFAADLMPTTAHLPIRGSWATTCIPWTRSRPSSAFVQEAIERKIPGVLRARSRRWRPATCARRQAADGQRQSGARTAGSESPAVRI